MRNALFALAAVTLVVSNADAQMTDGVRATADPRIWISASAGPAIFPQLNFLNDQSRDNISSGMKVSGSVQFSLGKVGGFGFTYATVTHDAELFANRTGSPCVSGCDASVKATSLLATLHVGGAPGFDMVYEASVGVTKFDDFEAEALPLGVRGSTTDFTGIIGYGAGYGFTPQLSVVLIADIGLVFHSRPDGEEIEGTAYSPFVGLRAGVRYGLWNRAR